VEILCAFQQRLERKAGARVVRNCKLCASKKNPAKKLQDFELFKKMI